MNELEEQPARVCHYFVDEAGDGMLFNKRKQIIVGREGCSLCFILGVLQVNEPDVLHEALDSLQSQLRADPYLAKVPSMRPDRRKTAIAFHAKDDCAEVRREVFRLLMQHDMRFFAVVRHKQTIVEKVLEHNKTRPTYRYHPNQLYDRCVSQLFRERLHKEESYVIRFSRRGNRARSDALRTAIEQARNNLRRKWGIAASAPIEIIAATPSLAGGLQAVDYFLWALQRLYERGEDRYWEYVGSKVTWSMTWTIRGRMPTERTTTRRIRSRRKIEKEQSWEYEDPLARATRHGAEFRSQLHRNYMSDMGNNQYTL